MVEWLEGLALDKSDGLALGDDMDMSSKSVELGKAEGLSLGAAEGLGVSCGNCMGPDMASKVAKNLSLKK